MTINYLKDRTLEKGQIVRVYRNLHNGLFSIKDKKSGLVVAHASSVLLSNCKFKVSDKGRERVRKERRKSVHAHIEGEYQGVEFENNLDTQAYYDPYKTDYFVDKSNGEVLDTSELVWCEGKDVYYK